MSSAIVAREQTRFTFKNPCRYMWHTGTVFGKELCYRITCYPVFSLFRITLWRIKLSFCEVPFPASIYPKGDLARVGKPA